RHHQGGDDRGGQGAQGCRAEVTNAATGARRAADRARAGRARPGREAGARQDGRRLSAERAARGIGGIRPQLGRRGALDMASTAVDAGTRLRTNVTRVHATCLFVITIAATVGSTLGWKGRGPLSVLATQPYGYVGLFQAYFLMFLLALVCLIGATRWPSRLWNAALLVAHL